MLFSGENRENPPHRFTSGKHTSAFKCLLKTDIETAIIAKCCERNTFLTLKLYRVTIKHLENSNIFNVYIHIASCRTLNLTILLSFCSLP